MEMTQPKPSVVEQIKTGLKRRRPNHRIYFLIFAASIALRVPVWFGVVAWLSYAALDRLDAWIVQSNRDDIVIAESGWVLDDPVSKERLSRSDQILLIRLSSFIHLVLR
jgi:hypothetical protein